jgi:hypothetical protein
MAIILSSFWRFEGFAVGFIDGVVQARAIGLEIDVAVGKANGAGILAGGNFIVANRCGCACSWRGNSVRGLETISQRGLLA